MAAQLHASLEPTELVDLRRVSVSELEPLLREEVAAWRDQLEWDFEKSADLVRRFIDMRSLNGAALVAGGRIAGYLYYVLEDAKGLIGDLYVAREYRTAAREEMLLAAAVEAIAANPRVRRIETQLLMMDFLANRPLPRAGFAGAFERNFMRLNLHRAKLGPGRPDHRVRIETWSDRDAEGAAQVVAAAYAGHIDSRINDQYRSQAGARRFLHNIVEYPGCGAFFRPASFVAFDPATRKLCGISLASLVAAESGHITQICVSPEVRGTGVGYALLRQSLTTLRELGCHSASLTVTAANQNAIALYESAGFQTIRNFPAYAWEWL